MELMERGKVEGVQQVSKVSKFKNDKVSRSLIVNCGFLWGRDGVGLLFINFGIV